jgi:prevent-host-death family protein
MSNQVNIHHAKTHLSQLVERVGRGEEIVIAKAGKPVARLVPLEACAARKPGLIKGRLTKAFFEPLSAEELESWYR